MAQLFSLHGSWMGKQGSRGSNRGCGARANLSSEPATDEERAQKQRLDSLLISKSRILDQLERAKHAAHRQVLLKGLKAIEKEIEENAVLSDTLTNAQNSNTRAQRSAHRLIKSFPIKAPKG